MTPLYSAIYHHASILDCRGEGACIGDKVTHFIAHCAWSDIKGLYYCCKYSACLHG